MIAVALVAGTLVLAAAAPASAHAQFPGVTNLPSGTQQAVTLHVPHERDESTYNVAIDVRLPAGWGVSGCSAPDTWTCSTSVDGSGLTIVHWAKASGAGPSANDEDFPLSLVVGPPGPGSFPTVQTYSNDEVVRWIEGPGGEEPAPVIVAGDAPPPSTAPPVHEPTTAPPPPEPEPEASAPQREPAETTAAPASDTAAASPTTAVPTTTAGGPTTNGVTTSTTVRAPSTTTTRVATSTRPTSGTAPTASTGGDDATAAGVDDDDAGNTGVWIAVILGIIAAGAGGTALYRRRGTGPG
jgi:hypothetical protein